MADSGGELKFMRLLWGRGGELTEKIQKKTVVSQMT